MESPAFIHIILHVGVPIGHDGRSVTGMVGIEAVPLFPATGHAVVIGVSGSRPRAAGEAGPWAARVHAVSAGLVAHTHE